MYRLSCLCPQLHALRRLGFALLLGIAAGRQPLAAQAAPAGNASLGGTILSDPAERPLPNADISFTKLGLTARSDSAGNFVIPGIPAGKHEVVFKLIGYEPITATITFNVGQKVEGDFLLKALPTSLGKVEVKAAAPVGNNSLAMIEFEARRKRGGGRFITQDVFEKAENRLMSDVLLRTLPGLHANAMGASGRAMASGRSTVSMSTAAQSSSSLDKFDQAQGAKADCYLQILLDGNVMYQATGGRPLFDINTINPTTVAGIEYYTTAQTPSQYQAAGSQCGTIVIWSRTR